jgi:1-deoxy-D-xylulose-5-phosphate synthase
MLAVPNMIVTAPKDGAELIGLLKAGLGQDTAPFCTRLPRDVSPDVPGDAAAIAPVPHATWEVLRTGRDKVAVLAVGTMVQESLAAAELLAAEGLDVTVVNCRYLKPYDAITLQAILAQHTHVLTVEEGTVVNGFGAMLSAVIHREAPEVRVAIAGVPDRIIYAAPRKRQLAQCGLDAASLAQRLRALHSADTEAVAG